MNDLRTYNFLPQGIVKMMDIIASDTFVLLATKSSKKVRSGWVTLLPPILITYMSSVLILSQPIANAFSFPSAIIATMDSSGKSTSMRAPLEVKPGHMMLAPDKTNLMAPRSTCNLGRRSGSIYHQHINMHTTSHHVGLLTLVQKLQSRKVRAIKVLEKQDHSVD